MARAAHRADTAARRRAAGPRSPGAIARRVIAARSRRRATLHCGPLTDPPLSLQDLYPNYSSRILVVNLPTYLMWFLRFVKGLLAEVTANKVQLLAGDDELRRYFDADGMPSIYRGARRADRPLDLSNCT